MKRVLTSILVIFIISVVFVVCEGEGEYPEGRDVVKSFGDGRYGIARMLRYTPGTEEYKNNPDIKMIYTLRDRKEQETIEPDVDKYLEKGSKVYVVGENGYTVLDYKTGKIENYKDISESPEEYSQIFDKQSKFKVIDKSK